MSALPKNLPAARLKIDQADQKITGILAKFNMATQISREDSIELPAEIETIFEQKSSPRELVTLVLKYVDLQSVKPDDLLGLSLALIERYYAVFDVVAHKKANPDKFAPGGVYNSYDKTRHEDVRDRNSKLVVEMDGNPKLGESVYNDLPNYFVAIQDEYLNHNAGPIARTLQAQPDLAA